MNRTALIYARIVIGALVATILCAWAFLPIAYGAVYHSTHLVSRLQGLVINRDAQGAVGSAITQAFLRSPSSSPHPTFIQGSASLDDEAIRGLLVDESTWAVVEIGPAVTQRLLQAQQSADASWNPRQAVTVWVSQARNSAVVEDVLLNYIEAVLENVLPALNQQLSVSYLQSATSQNVSALHQTLTKAPQTVVGPLSYSVSYVTTFDIPAVQVTEFVGLVILLIFAAAQVGAAYGARLQTGLLGADGQVPLRVLIFVRLVPHVATSFVLGWAFSGISAAFGVTFTAIYKAGFVLYFLCVWLSLLAIILAIEMIMIILPVAAVPFFIIFFLIANAAVIALPMDLMPHFYRYGYAMIFYNGVRIINALVFGTRNHLAVNFGVLLAWVALSFVLIPIASFLTWRRAQKKAPVLAQNQAAGGKRDEGESHSARDEEQAQVSELKPGE